MMSSPSPASPSSPVAADSAAPKRSMATNVPPASREGAGEARQGRRRTSPGRRGRPSLPADLVRSSTLDVPVPSATAAPPSPCRLARPPPGPARPAPPWRVRHPGHGGRRPDRGRVRRQVTASARTGTTAPAKPRRRKAMTMPASTGPTATVVASSPHPGGREGSGGGYGHSRDCIEIGKLRTETQLHPSKFPVVGHGRVAPGLDPVLDCARTSAGNATVSKGSSAHRRGARSQHVPRCAFPALA
ncbi:hypothetical protein SMICM304S_02154 [Streptomyces microflavus]